MDVVDTRHGFIVPLVRHGENEKAHRGRPWESQNGTETGLIEEIHRSCQKEKVLELVTLEPFHRVAGAGFEPATFGL